ncbi:ribonuclease P protein component [Ideonella azotifigens]|uniref:Ribonuclease P protein component n=2 Tax=Ideonella azotifigens TaxID=513160 RepID=A0ABP3V1J6_9BURK|nr:ribonuclease P protein component [Ideonella azotifigens]MCD2340198.1 ribonuclease P protein component [Ideonella azotifigens]
MIGRILRSADFQRVLAAPQRSRSAHFAVHYVASGPSTARRPAAKAAPLACEPVVPQLSPELSTGGSPESQLLVDESSPAAADPLPEGHWLGLVVPKRHAKRAVTRNLIKRQLRAAMLHHMASLPAGLWVVRLRAPFDRQQFLSPASENLRECAHDEIAVLLTRAARSPLPAPPRPPSQPGARGRGRAAAG